jgi:hypothetical protein
MAVDSREDQINQLRDAIAPQEVLRPQLGDATVELSLKPASCAVAHEMSRSRRSQLMDPKRVQRVESIPALASANCICLAVNN